MTWFPELVDLVRPGRRDTEDGILTTDLVWAGLAFAGVAAGRALHRAMVGHVIDAGHCRAAGDHATTAMTEALELRGVEPTSTLRGRLWTVLVRPERGSVAVTVAFEDGASQLCEPERIRWTAAALFAGLQIGMSYPSQVRA